MPSMPETWGKLHVGARGAILCRGGGLGKQMFSRLDDQHRDKLLKANAKSSSKPSMTPFKAGAR
jgi:hypothetical protein